MEVGMTLHDAMNPVERMRAIAEGKPFDRLPFMPLLGETASHLVGATISQYRHSARLMVDVEIATYSVCGQDGIGVGPGYQGLAEALGTKLIYPENNTPYVGEPVLKDWSAFDGLKPAEPKKAGKLPLYIEALKTLKETMGNEVPVLLCGGRTAFYAI
jgi:uroporphyrinogen decarboxylase